MGTMNVARSFVTFLENEGYGIFGTNIFVNIIPKEAPDNCICVIAEGGAPETRNQTGETLKNYILNIRYRALSDQTVYENIQGLEELINSDACTQLSGYDTIDMQATQFPVSEDIDDENRSIGLLQVTLRIYN